MDGYFDAQAVCLETERLILRPWRQADLEDMYAYARVDGVGQMAGWKPHGSRAESESILQLFIRENKTLALEEKATGRVIGSIGLEKTNHLGPSFDSLRGREIGYVLSKAYWGRGLMPEAVAAVIHYCFQVLHYDFLTCGYFQWNSQSRRVNEKLGFRFYREIDVETQLGTVEHENLNVLYHPDFIGCKFAAGEPDL